MKLLRKVTQLDNDKIESNITNNNLDAKTEDISNASHQFSFAYNPVLRIQKAWRSYRDNKLVNSPKTTPEPDFQSFHSFNNPANKINNRHSTHLDNRAYYAQNLKNNNFEFCCHEMSKECSGKNEGLTKAPYSLASRLGIESEPDSVASDYSEIAEPLKEHLANLQIVSKQDFDLNNLYSQTSMQKSQDEDEADYQRRIRKINLLSLAQEFAALKKMNSDALPFDLHQDKYKDMGSMSDTASETDDFTSDIKHEQSNRISLVDINNGNTLIRDLELPPTSCSSVPDVVKAVNGTESSRLDEINEKCSIKFEENVVDYGGNVITIGNEDCQDRVSNDNMFVNWKPQIISQHEDKQWVGNREDIRRKLAFYGDEDLDLSDHHSGLCFVNEAANDTENVKNKCDVTCARPDIIPSNKIQIMSSSLSNDKEDFFTRQARLQTEAKMALAQVRPMAHMQLQLEKQKVTKSPLADIVGMPGYGDGMSKKLARPVMSRMNIAQLQVVVNDLHAQIEALNDELMQQLVIRDDLHMAQDSMLVDIEDLTGRAQEFAARVNKKRESSKYV